MSQPGPEQIFISYSHKDVQWKDEFERMLGPARERGLIRLWSDENIPAGEKWHENILEALQKSRVGLLLVSDHFLDSSFIGTEELARLLAAAERGSCAIRWVPISACLYNVTSLGQIQACWDPKRPLDELPPTERKAAIQKICIQLVEEFGNGTKVSADRRDGIRSRLQAALGGKYDLVDEVATGKFSIFYRAERRRPTRTVGIKALVASELDDWARKGFGEGVERALGLTSPSFIKIFDYGLNDSPEFLVTEFVEGEQLTKVLPARPNGFPLYKVKSILLDLAKAIEEAHQRGWQRGEMCPSDILLEESGLPRISAIDFSNVLREQSMLSGNFLVDRESLTYMSPERYHGHARTELTDQYSLGLIATELLGGPRLPRVVNPCDLQTKPELFSALESGQGDWAARSPEFTGVVCRMLRVDPEGRWPSMREVRNVLREIEVAESPDEIDRRIATASYVRLQAGGVEGERRLYGTFYKKLFAAAPEVERHFLSIDLERQYQLLNRAIHSLLEFRQDSRRSRERLEEIASRHVRFQLTRRHYDVFLEVFLETIAEVGELDPAGLASWRKTLSQGMEFFWEHQSKLTSIAGQSSVAPAEGKAVARNGRRKAKTAALRPSATTH